jgi:hypothetical protein
MYLLDIDDGINLVFQKVQKTSYVYFLKYLPMFLYFSLLEHQINHASIFEFYQNHVYKYS